MGKRAWSTPLNNTNAIQPANIERLFNELHDAFIAGGLVQADDTGQLASFEGLAIGATTTYGYRVYRFNDSFQSNSPIFIRVTYQYLYNNSSYTAATFNIAAGTGTDGAGNLSGSLGNYVPIPVGSASMAAGTSAPLASLVCGGEGFFWLAWKVGAKPGQVVSTAPAVKAGQTTTIAWFAIYRECDDTGAFQNGAISFVSQPTKPVAATPTIVPLDSSAELRCNPNGANIVTRKMTSPLLMDVAPTIGGKLSVSRVFALGNNGVYATPVMAAAAQAGTAIGTTIPLAVVGSATRTYMSIGDTSTLDDTLPNTYQASTPIFLWEGDDA